MFRTGLSVRDGSALGLFFFFFFFLGAKHLLHMCHVYYDERSGNPGAARGEKETWKMGARCPLLCLFDPM